MILFIKLYKIKEGFPVKMIKPCAKCPYKLGLVQTLVNPCPQCRLNGYNMAEVFKKQIMNASPESDAKGKK